MKWVWRSARWLFVSVGIVVLTSFSIDATDALRGSQSALSIFARQAVEGGCPAGMTAFDLADGVLCVDTYENSVGESCPDGRPQTELATKNNVDAAGCKAVSKPDATPWTYVSYHQAKTLCAKRETRLPTPTEWYEAGLGTPDTEGCNLNGSLAPTGSHAACVSARGAYDMVGNVWEWVDGEVVAGVYASRAVPGEGYVAEVDTAGIPVLTDSSPSTLYNDDYFWSDAVGTYALMRGGFYGSRSDGGLYAVHAKTAPSFASAATGFRCVLRL